MSLERVFIFVFVFYYRLRRKGGFDNTFKSARTALQRKFYWIFGGSTLYKLSSVLQSYSLHVLIFFWRHTLETYLLVSNKSGRGQAQVTCLLLEWPKHQKAGVEGMWNSSKAQTLDKWKHYCSWGPFPGISLLFFSK